MYDVHGCTRKWASLALVALSLALISMRPVGAQVALDVALGTDYLQTSGGTFFNYGGPIGVVPLKGLPTGPGNTDTMVQRLQDANLSAPAPIPIQIVSLSLRDIAPVNIGGNFFDVFVTLDPANLSNDTGQMLISGNLSGGTFQSNLNVFAKSHFQQVGNPGNNFDVFSNALLSNSGALWGPTPGPDTLLVNGPDNDNISDPNDQKANLHSGLSTNEVDFFPIGVISEAKPAGQAVHNAQLASPSIPEPSSVLQLGLGMTMLAGLALRRRKRVS